AVRRGEADALICGLQGRFIKHARDIHSIIGLAPHASQLSGLSMLLLNRGVFFLADTYVNIDPSVDELVAITLQARDHLKRFNIEARAALLSYSDFGAREGETSAKMRAVYERLQVVA